MCEDRFVVAHPPGAEALAHVAVQIDGVAHAAVSTGREEWYTLQLSGALHSFPLARGKAGMEVQCLVHSAMASPAHPAPSTLRGRRPLTTSQRSSRVRSLPQTTAFSQRRTCMRIASRVRAMSRSRASNSDLRLLQRDRLEPHRRRRRQLRQQRQVDAGDLAQPGITPGGLAARHQHDRLAVGRHLDRAEGHTLGDHLDRLLRLPESGRSADSPGGPTADRCGTRSRRSARACASANSDQCRPGTKRMA